MPTWPTNTFQARELLCWRADLQLGPKTLLNSTRRRLFDIIKRQVPSDAGRNHSLTKLARKSFIGGDNLHSPSITARTTPSARSALSDSRRPVCSAPETARCRCGTTHAGRRVRFVSQNSWAGRAARRQRATAKDFGGRGNVARRDDVGAHPKRLSRNRGSRSHAGGHRKRDGQRHRSAQRELSGGIRRLLCASIGQKWNVHHFHDLARGHIRRVTMPHRTRSITRACLANAYPLIPTRTPMNTYFPYKSMYYNTTKHQIP